MPIASLNPNSNSSGAPYTLQLLSGGGALSRPSSRGGGHVRSLSSVPLHASSLIYHPGSPSGPLSSLFANMPPAQTHGTLQLSASGGERLSASGASGPSGYLSNINSCASSKYPSRRSSLDSAVDHLLTPWNTVPPTPYNAESHSPPLQLRNMKQQQQQQEELILHQSPQAAQQQSFFSTQVSGSVHQHSPHQQQQQQQQQASQDSPFLVDRAVSFAPSSESNRNRTSGLFARRQHSEPRSVLEERLMLCSNVVLCIPPAPVRECAFI